MVAIASLSSFETTFGALLTGVGVMFALVGLVLARASGRMPGGERVEGRIVGFDTTDPPLIRLPGGPPGGGRGFGATLIHRPKVSFLTRDGRPVTATARFGTNPRRGKIGDVVSVCYDPRDPARVRVRTARALGSCMEAAFVLFGVALAAMGIAIMSSA